MTTTPPIPPLTAPTSDDVAVLLRARTKDLDGQELGVFTENTRPTDAEVSQIIERAYAEVTGNAGVNLGARCAGLAQSLIVIRAAMWVEGSYWPEQIRVDRSIFRELSEQYTAGLATLLDCVAGNLPGGVVDEDTGEVTVALSFGELNVRGWTSAPAPYVPPRPVSGPPVDYEPLPTED